MTKISKPMTTLVVGATGATGRRVVRYLLDRGHEVRVVVRSEDRMREALSSLPGGGGKADSELLSIREASPLDLSDGELRDLVNGCGAVVSCLGHNITFKGMYGHPRYLVRDSVRRLCGAIESGASDGEGTGPVKFIMMGSNGVANPDGTDDVRPLSERMIIGLIRCLVPPHRDNEAAAAYLHDDVGRGDESGAVGWCVVRPDDLIEGEVSGYDLFSKPRGSLFGGGQATRANVAHCMAELIDKEGLWAKWRFKMPVLMNSLESKKND